MPLIPRISEAETKVMETVWARSPITAAEIIDALAGQSDWKPKTIKTLIARLVQKQVLGFRKQGKAYLYYPLVERDSFSRAQRRSFLSRFYGGALKPMLAAFIEEEDLSSEEITELRQLLKRKGRGDS